MNTRAFSPADCCATRATVSPGAVQGIQFSLPKRQQISTGTPYDTVRFKVGFERSPSAIGVGFSLLASPS